MKEIVPIAIVRKDNPNFNEAIKQAIQEEEGGGDISSIIISKPNANNEQTITVVFTDSELGRYYMYPTWEY